MRRRLTVGEGGWRSSGRGVLLGAAEDVGLRSQHLRLQDNPFAKAKEAASASAAAAAKKKK